MRRGSRSSGQAWAGSSSHPQGGEVVVIDEQEPVRPVVGLARAGGDVLGPEEEQHQSLSSSSRSKCPMTFAFAPSLVAARRSSVFSAKRFGKRYVRTPKLAPVAMRAMEPLRFHAPPKGRAYRSIVTLELIAPLYEPP